MIITLIYLIIGLILIRPIIRMKYSVVLILFWLPILILLTLFFITIHAFPKLILKMFGWKVIGKFPEVKKSITIMAPHTSAWDAVLGKIALLATGLPHTILSSAHLFKYPLKPFMEKGLNAIPIGGVPGKNAIWDVCEYLKDHDTNIIICPEGQLRATDKWNPGFWMMSYKAEVPIVMATMDYRDKTIRFTPNVIPTRTSRKTVYKLMREFYEDSGPKYPEKFLLPGT